MMIADPAIRARWATWIAERLTRHADTDSGIEFELTRLAADGAWHRHLVDGGPGPQLSAIRRRLIEATQPAGTRKIGRAHVCTPVTNAHLVCRLMLEKQILIDKLINNLIHSSGHSQRQ